MGGGGLTLADSRWGWGVEGLPPGFPSLPAHLPGIEDIFGVPGAGVVGDVAALLVEGRQVGQEVEPYVTRGSCCQIRTCPEAWRPWPRGSCS